MYREFVNKSLNEAKLVLDQFCLVDDNLATIESVALLIANTLEKGAKIISIGNGGSMSDSMHFAEELSGRYKHDRSPLNAYAISDPAYLSCVANDYGYEHVFSRALQGQLRTGDLLIAFSTSGNSLNIVNAVKQAQLMNCQTIGMLGNDGGLAANYCNYKLIIKSSETARIQEMHIKIVHILIDLIEKILNIGQK